MSIVIGYASARIKNRRQPLDHPWQRRQHALPRVRRQQLHRGPFARRNRLHDGAYWPQDWRWWPTPWCVDEPGASRRTKAKAYLLDRGRRGGNAEAAHPENLAWRAMRAPCTPERPPIAATSGSWRCATRWPPAPRPVLPSAEELLPRVCGARTKARVGVAGSTSGHGGRGALLDHRGGSKATTHRRPSARGAGQVRTDADASTLKDPGAGGVLLVCSYGYGSNQPNQIVERDTGCRKASTPGHYA